MSAQLLIDNMPDPWQNGFCGFYRERLAPGFTFLCTHTILHEELIFPKEVGVN